MSPKKESGSQFLKQQRSSLPINATRSLMKPGASIDEKPEEEAEEEEQEEGDGAETAEGLSSLELPPNSSGSNSSTTGRRRSQRSIFGGGPSIACSGSSNSSSVSSNMSNQTARRLGPRPAEVKSQSGSQKASDCLPPQTPGSSNKRGSGELPVGEYRASLQPVYEPKHFIANCVPIQIIPLPSRRQSSVAWGQSSASSLSNQRTGLTGSGQQGCENIAEKRSQTRHRSLPQVIAASSQQQPSSSDNQQQQTDKITTIARDPHHSHCHTFQHQQFIQRQHANSPTSGQSHKQHPQHHPRPHLRRYSTIVVTQAANGGSGESIFQPNYEALSRRRGRRLSVISPPNFSGGPTSGHQNQLYQQHNHHQTAHEIKVMPTQAKKQQQQQNLHQKQLLRPGRRHTLADVRQW